MDQFHAKLAAIAISFIPLCSTWCATPVFADSTVATATKEQDKQRREIDEHLNALIKHRRTRGGWLGNGELPLNVKFIADIPYVQNAGKSQRLDLYLPQTESGVSEEDVKSTKEDSQAKNESSAKLKTGLPLVIWIHGGGWRGGDKKGGPMRALLNAGFAVASINYRLSGEAKWPAQFDDCRSAISYLESHAGEYGIDPNRVALWGASAGGHLVLMLALKDGTAHGIKAVCDWFGPTDLVSYIQSQKTTPNGLEMIKQLLQTDQSGLLPAAKDASPVTFIKKDSSMPSLLIVHGKQDPLVPVDQSENLAKRLIDLGYSNITLSVIKGGHGFPGFGNDTIQNTIGFFKSTLK
jgi:acetyl esterase/lipase